jgi:hypothetical protein
MEKAQVAVTVEEALREVQMLGGYEWEALAPKAEVIGTLEGFDSLTAIEATVLVEQKLSEKLGRSEPLSLGKDSIFVSEDGRRALCLDEVVAAVAAMLEAA